MDLTEISRRLENIIRFGTVSTVDLDAVRCRVKSGSIETEWLRWHTVRAGATLTWDPPTVGEQVVVLSPSGEIANGVVLFGFNSDQHPAPSASADTHLVRLPDGAEIGYDHTSHAYSVVVPSGGKITLNVGSTTLELSANGTTLTTPKFEGVRS